MALQAHGLSQLLALGRRGHGKLGHDLVRSLFPGRHRESLIEKGPGQAACGGIAHFRGMDLFGFFVSRRKGRHGRAASGIDPKTDQGIGEFDFILSSVP